MATVPFSPARYAHRYEIRRVPWARWVSLSGPPPPVRLDSWTWHEGLPMFCAPRLEVLVLTEDGVDHLIENVVRGLANELGIGEQGFVRLAIQSRDVPDQLLSTRTRFYERHAPSMNGIG
jgi:hypothetical protein